MEDQEGDQELEWLIFPEENFLVYVWYNKSSSLRQGWVGIFHILGMVSQF